MTAILTSYLSHIPFSFPNPKTQQTHFTTIPQPPRAAVDDGAGIPHDDVKLLAKFKSRHNFIRVVEVSRRADHPFAGTRLLLLDSPGNIHSISTTFPSRRAPLPPGGTYFDLFASLPPLLPPGPLALLGLGAASAASSVLRLNPSSSAALHAWELDPAVVSVARHYFGLAELEREFPGRLFVHVGDALRASPSASSGGFAGMMVDLFIRGSVVPELQEAGTWRRLRRCLRKGGRVMVNVGGTCVEAEEPGRDGGAVMEDTLEAMGRVFGDDLFVLRLGNGGDESVVALTGKLPDVEEWRRRLPKSLAGYVDMWRPFRRG